MLLIEIASPQILIPASPQSVDMIVIELGNITISNQMILIADQKYEVYLFLNYFLFIS